MAKTTEKLDDLLSKYKLTEDELITTLSQLASPKKNLNNVVEQIYHPNHTKFLVMGDSHIGSKQSREDIFYDALKKAKKEKVDAIYHVGDLIEGMSNREGHFYELDIAGTSNQCDRLCEILNTSTIPFNYIKGNHDNWSMKKSNQGFDIAKYISSKVPNAKYLGDMRVDIKLHENLDMRLTHEGNSSYALSYSGQKRINALEGGTKPDIWFNGHIHKALFMMYRNINYFESGCLQSQTDFMAEKGSPAMLGYWLIDLKYDKGGIKEITPKFNPFY